MRVNISFSSIKKSLSAFLKRFHVMIFVVVVVGGLTVAVLLLNSIIVQSGDSGGYTPDTPTADFDQTTIERIEELKTRNQTGSELDLSQGRVNPFVE